MKRGKSEGRVAPLLRRGQENAVKAAALVEALGLHDKRQLRNLIERERAAGILVLSTVKGSGGYFLPSENPAQAREEIAAFVHTVMSRSLNSILILKAARRALRECDGQLEMLQREDGGDDGQEESCSEL